MNMVRPVNARRFERLQYFTCCEISSLIRNNAVWNAITVEKATDHSFAGIYISRIKVYFIESKVLSFHDGNGSV